MNNMTNPKKKPPQIVKKPYATGTPADSETWKKAAFFFGTLILVTFLFLIVCSMTGFDQDILRIAVNLAIITAVILVFYNNGMNYGTNAVARGEIVYQKREKGREVAESEVKLCYHPLKGLIPAVLGTVPLLILTVILAVTAEKQTTTQGMLPSWMQSYLGRDGIGDALKSYTDPGAMSFTEIVRIAVRIILLPYINLVGTSDMNAVLWVERLGPVLVLLPAAAYGIGFTRGPSVRARVHTEITENRKKRIRKERKERKLRRTAENNHRGPQQLN